MARSKLYTGFPGDSVVESPPAWAGVTGDPGSSPGSGRSPGGGNGNPHQYSYLENPMDRGAWWATVNVIAESDTTQHTHRKLYMPDLQIEQV